MHLLLVTPKMARLADVRMEKQCFGIELGARRPESLPRSM